MASKPVSPISHLTLLDRLEDLLKKDQVLNRYGESGLEHGIHEACLKLKVWISDTGIEDKKTLILTKLPTPLAEDVDRRLQAINEPLSQLETRLTQPKSKLDALELRGYVERVSKAATLLSHLAEPIMDLQEQLEDDGIASQVREVLKQRLTRATTITSKSTVEGISTPTDKLVDDASDDLRSLGQGLLHPTLRQPLASKRIRSGDENKMDGSSELEGSSLAAPLAKGTGLYPVAPSSRKAKQRFTPISQDEVRLAQLHPGKPTQPLEFSVSNIDILDLPSHDYVALSYAWDFSPENTWKSVSIRPRSPDSADGQDLPIMSYIYDGLEKVRRRDHPVTVWVDAVCLDLGNDKEKQVQSTNFAEIFYHANSTVLWLGPSVQPTLQAFLSVPRICQRALTGAEFNLTSEEAAVLFGKLIPLVIHEIFSRRWIVQELALSSAVELRCGDEKLDWQEFLTAVAAWGMLRNRKPLLAAKLFKTATLKNVGAPTNSLMTTSCETVLYILKSMLRRNEEGRAVSSILTLDELVFSLSGLGSGSVQDAIYAFVSIAADTSILSRAGDAVRGVRVSPDWLPVYEKRAGDLNVFDKFLQHAIKKSQSLDILCWLWAPPVNFLLPSWMKETNQATKSFNKVIVQFSRTYNFSRQRSKYHAAGNSTPLYRFDSESAYNTIFVKGFSLGHIEAVSTRMAQGIVTRECLELAGLNFPSNNNRWEAQDIPERVWRTLIADRTIAGDPPLHYPRVLAHCLGEAVDGDLVTIAAEDALDSADIRSEFLRNIHDTVYNRKIFRAGDDDMVGLGPAEAAVGDIVCILFGCSVPVILRERLAGIAPYYELIGECFVYGIMEGELFQRLAAKELEDRTVEFKLK